MRYVKHPPRRRDLPRALAGGLAGLSMVLLMSLLGERRPNVVMIVVDTLRADAVSTEFGAGETPHIAALAERGTAFSRAFAHAPMTLPAHAALFSGRQPHETGVYNNGDRVPADLPLLAETLRDAGYQTEAVVSLATLWPEGAGTGLDRGFGAFDPGHYPVAPAEDAGERFEAALERLDGDRPFFLFAHLSDPHEPYNEHAPHFHGKARGHRAELLLDGERVAELSTSISSDWSTDLELPPGTHSLVLRSDQDFKLRTLECELAPTFVEGELLKPGRRVEVQLTNASKTSRSVPLRLWINDTPSREEIHARYGSEVAAADEAIGRLIEGLKRRGLWDNTLVVLTSDHGEALGEHGTIGHVVNLYDELLHVPLVMAHPALPGVSQPAISQPVGHVDVLPTVLDLLGVDAPSDLPGHSAVSAMAGACDAEARAYSSSIMNRQRGLSVYDRAGHYIDDDGQISWYDHGVDGAEAHDRAGEAPELAVPYAIAAEAWWSGLEELVPPLDVERSAEELEMLKLLGYAE